MTALKDMIAAFRGRSEFPIEVEEVRDWLIKFGMQDEITFYPIEVNPGRLRGLVIRDRSIARPYAESLWMLSIGFWHKANPCWQRLVCCKEMMHAWDAQSSCVDNIAELKALCENLSSSLDMKDLDEAVWSDHLAVYKALAVLAPMEQIELLRKNYENGKITTYQIALLFRIPEVYVNDLFNPIYKRLVDCLVEGKYLSRPHNEPATA